MLKLTAAHFRGERLMSPDKGPVVVLFWRNLSPCKNALAIMEKLAEQYGLVLGVVDVGEDAEAAFAETLGIVNIPAVVFYRDGSRLFFSEDMTFQDKNPMPNFLVGSYPSEKVGEWLEAHGVKRKDS